MSKIKRRCVRCDKVEVKLDICSKCGGTIIAKEPITPGIKTPKKTTY